MCAQLTDGVCAGGQVCVLVDGARVELVKMNSYDRWIQHVMISGVQQRDGKSNNETGI